MENQGDNDAAATPAMAQTDSPAKTVENAQTTDVEATGSNNSVAVENSEADVKTLTLAVDKIDINNSVEDETNLPKNSPVVQIPNADEIKPTQQEVIVPQTQLTAPTESIVIVDEKPDVDPNISEKSVEPEVEPPKVVDVLNDNPQVYANEEDCDEKEQQFNMSARERSPDGESSSEKGLVDDEEDGGEGEEEVSKL